MFYLGGNTDEETEKKGIVLITLKVGVFNPGDYSPKMLNMQTRMIYDMPIRLAATHKLMGDSSSTINRMLDFCLTAATVDTRIRVKIHRGTYPELTCRIPMHYSKQRSPLTFKDPTQNGCMLS